MTGKTPADKERELADLFARDGVCFDDKNDGTPDNDVVAIPLAVFAELSGVDLNRVAMIAAQYARRAHIDIS